MRAVTKSYWALVVCFEEKSHLCCCHCRRHRRRHLRRRRRRRCRRPRRCHSLVITENKSHVENF